MEKLRDLSEQYVKNNRYIIRLQSIMWPLLDVFSSLGLILVLWFGARKVISGQTSLGTIVAFILYIGLLSWPAIALGLGCCNFFSAAPPLLDGYRKSLMENRSVRTKFGHISSRW